MKKMLMIAAVALATISTAHAAENRPSAIERDCARHHLQDGEVAETDEQRAAYDR